jgi:hypothetical protein
LIGGFASYYTLHGRSVMAVIGWGITLNCVPVVVCGVRQRAHDRASGAPIGSFWDRGSRAEHVRQNPHMLRDTMILTLGTLLPFAGVAAVLFDAARSPEA